MDSKHKKAALLGAGLFFLFYNASAGAEDKKENDFFIDDRYSDFSLTRSTISDYSKRNLNQIEQIIVHHAGVTGQNAEDYADYHTGSKGWSGIGYHYVIERNGNLGDSRSIIVQGNPLDNVSYHTRGQNTKSIGICLSGNFEVEQPTPEQMEALTWLIAHIRKELPQDLEVYGHKDFGSTSCPGINLYPELQNYKLTV